MKAFPEALALEALGKRHRRRHFRSGQVRVDQWLSERALQSQEKHLTTTKVLASNEGDIAGFYSLATGQIDFSELPADIAKKLPRRQLPAAFLAWLGVAEERQGGGLGTLLFARAIRDCYDGGRTFAFVAVVIDCIDENAKRWYQRWDFRELPGQSNRLFIEWARLDAMMR